MRFLRKLFILAPFVFLLTAASVLAATLPPPPAGGPPIPPRTSNPPPTDQIIVKFKPTVSDDTKTRILSDVGIPQTRRLRLRDTVTAKVGSSRVEIMRTLLATSASVEYVEPDYIASALDTPDDPLYPKSRGVERDARFRFRRHCSCRYRY